MSLGVCLRKRDIVCVCEREREREREKENLLNPLLATTQINLVKSAF